MKYTKGPWEVTETLGQTAITIKHDSIGIAPYTICHIWPHIKEGDPIANARLIAAAPELLEVCKEALDLIAKHDGCSRMSIDLLQTSENLKKVIAKSEGE